MRKFYSTRKLHLVIFVFSFLILTIFSFDPDLGWHLAIGERFLKTGEIIRVDQFSWTVPGYVWGNSYFAYQILVAYLVSNFGFEFSAMVFGLLASVGILILIPSKLRFLDVIITVIAAALLNANLGVRPHTISFLFFALLIRFLAANLFSKRKSFVFWFLFFLLWANFHNAFLIGLFVFSGYRVIGYLFKIANKKKADVFAPVINIVAAFAGTFFTPFGYLIWKAILNDALFPKMYTAIAEFVSFVVVDSTRVLYVLSGIVFIYSLRKNFEKIGPSMVFISSFLFMLPFLGAYFVFFWGAIFIFITTRHLKINIKREIGFWEKMPIFLGITALTLAILVKFAAGLTKSLYSGDQSSFSYPKAAVAFMRANGIKDNIFNEYPWGGYLEWQYIDAKVFIDGRMTGWHKDGRSMLSEYLEIKNGNCEAATRYSIKTLLINSGSKPACFGDFNLVYKDEVAEVWTKQVTLRLNSGQVSDE